MFSLYVVVCVVAMLAAFWLCTNMALTGIIGFLANGFIGMAITAGVVVLVFGRTRPAREAFGIVARIFSHVVAKLPFHKAQE